MSRCKKFLLVHFLIFSFAFTQFPSGFAAPNTEDAVAQRGTNVWRQVLDLIEYPMHRPSMSFDRYLYLGRMSGPEVDLMIAGLKAINTGSPFNISAMRGHMITDILDSDPTPRARPRIEQINQLLLSADRIDINLLDLPSLRALADMPSSDFDVRIRRMRSLKPGETRLRYLESVLGNLISLDVKSEIQQPRYRDTTVPGAGLHTVQVHGPVIASSEDYEQAQTRLRELIERLEEIQHIPEQFRSPQLLADIAQVEAEIRVWAQAVDDYRLADLPR